MTASDPNDLGQGRLWDSAKLLIFLLFPICPILSQINSISYMTQKENVTRTGNAIALSTYIHNFLAYGVERLKRFGTWVTGHA